ncbi:DUF2489 domain-containing protein [Halopseudomonas aestusnigri]|uniref:DUF2489 domain-containing protein n=1 Tax=Halopseudomonas aestusnigri TaxID=857252 RepID=A0AAQ1JQ46_9GAMM|nr:DUF2489 domain-containing protein [Halopseudomonas aestusnigri]OWL88948.1 hypothetical protein B7O88_09845 [Halopseudomonas aestusnigri]SEG32032.1 Protein of unknown function [Halopseudomonas aestusnigri]
MQTHYWLIAAGILIILALATYAWTLWRKVWQQDEARAKALEARNDRLSGDIRIIAQSLLDGQVPTIEGAIRIKVLLDNYQGERREGLDVTVFDLIYEQTAHIPTHQAWKDLSRAERKLHLRLMDTLERDHRPAVEAAARALSKGVN